MEIRRYAPSRWSGCCVQYQGVPSFSRPFVSIGPVFLLASCRRLICRLRTNLFLTRVRIRAKPRQKSVFPRVFYWQPAGEIRQSGQYRKIVPTVRAPSETLVFCNSPGGSGYNRFPGDLCLSQNHPARHLSFNGFSEKQGLKRPESPFSTSTPVYGPTQNSAINRTSIS